MKRPEILYKYTVAPTVQIILESGRLRWSNPSQFNDLNEFKIMPVFSPSIEQDWEAYLQVITDIVYAENHPSIEILSPQNLSLVTMLKQRKANLNSKQDLFKTINTNCLLGPNTMEEQLRSFTESVRNQFARVFCLTSLPTNDLMWAHYAGNHSGCVLGFRHMEELDTPFSAAKPVKYCDGSPIIGTGIDFLLYGDTRKLRQKTIEAIYYTKQINWAYENEWRVITWRYDEITKDFGDYKFYQDELESITFGPRTGNNYKKAICNILTEKYRSTKIYEMINKNGKSVRILKS